MRSLITYIAIASICYSCGKDRTREQIKENIKVLEVAKQETDDEQLKDTLDIAIRHSREELKEDTKIQKEIKKYNEREEIECHNCITDSAKD